MWFLTPARRPLPAGEWIDFIAHFGEDDEQQGELVAGKPNDWRQIHVTYSDGSWSFDFERYSVAGVTDIKKWTDDLDFFRGWAGAVEPGVNAQWVQQYLTRVRMVYMFRCSNSAPDSSLVLVREIIDSLRHDYENVGGAGGLLYAELEGWSNEEGYHITWEFSDGVSGSWWMALRGNEGWRAFQMDLGNATHRKAFRAGKVPPGLNTRTYRGAQ
jgi:hypothetical protein